MLNLYSDQPNELNEFKKYCADVSNSAICYSIKVILYSHHVRTAESVTAFSRESSFAIIAKILKYDWFVHLDPAKN